MPRYVLRLNGSLTNRQQHPSAWQQCWLRRCLRTRLCKRDAARDEMRGAQSLAKQVCILLSARGPHCLAWNPSSPLPGMQRLFRTNGLSHPLYACNVSSVDHPACLKGASPPGGLAACGLIEHRQQDVAVPRPLCSQNHWRQRRLVQLPAASSATFTVSAASHSAMNDDEGPEGELHAVETAIRANALIFAAKLGVFFISNSSAMLAEAVHSMVDIANQMLLRVGIKKAQKQPTEMHPYGYARDQFIWPLISAVGIFCCGAGVSFVHGVTGLFEAHRELGDLYWNFVVLGVSGVLESHSLYVAVNTLRRRAAQQSMGLLAYIKTGADPAAVAVMMEDGAAVAGLVVAGGCLALCQMTGAVYWDSVGSIAVSALLGVVAVTLIQRNRKWLIGKSMPKAQEDLILDHLGNDCVIRQVSNIKSEELGVRQYRFQADIAFDGEELARRALDRCGRTRLFKALDTAVRRHDPHALDALLMQFAAVIVSTTGAEVDRLEREIMRLVPGTRWVDLETDRGKPARLSTAYTAAAAAAMAHLQQQQQQRAAADAADAGSSTTANQPQQQQLHRELGPLDSINEQDHLADLTEYPLGSLMSFDEPLPDNVPEWIKAFAPSGAAASLAAAAAAGGDEQNYTSFGGGSSSSSSIDSLPSALQTSAVQTDLYEDDTYQPFCETMFEQLQPSATPGSSPSIDTDRVAREAANRLQMADWKEAEAYSWSNRGNVTTGLPGSTAPGSEKKPFCESMAAVMAKQPEPLIRGRGMGGRSKITTTIAAPPAVRDDWGQQEKERRVQELLDLEDNIMGTEQQQYKPFCEKMFQSLHPNQPQTLPSAQRLQQQHKQETEEDHEPQRRAESG